MCFRSGNAKVRQTLSDGIRICLVSAIENKSPWKNFLEHQIVKAAHSVEFFPKNDTFLCKSRPPDAALNRGVLSNIRLDA
jgi:hypothetical protein